MPKAKPPPPPETPAPLTAEEERSVLEIVHRYYGPSAVVRNWGPVRRQLQLHIESDQDIGMARYECVGLIACAVDCLSINVPTTRRGDRIHGYARVAYRQGVILGQAMDETAHLLSSPRNAERLAEAIAELDAGHGRDRRPKEL